MSDHQHPSGHDTAGMTVISTERDVAAGPFTLIINTREYIHRGHEISFDEAVSLVANQLPQGPQVTYTVTFTEAHEECREGSLVRDGKPIKVKDRMIICVKHSHES